MLEYRSDPDEQGQRLVVCPACGFERFTPWPVEKVRHQCRKPDGKPVGHGPGWHLAGMLKRIGIRPKEDGSCRCLKKQTEMDYLGPAGCRRKFAELLAHLQEKFDEVGVLEKLKAGMLALAHDLPLSLEGMLEEAIRRAEANE